LDDLARPTDGFRNPVLRGGFDARHGRVHHRRLDRGEGRVVAPAVPLDVDLQSTPCIAGVHVGQVPARLRDTGGLLDTRGETARSKNQEENGEEGEEDSEHGHG